MLRIDTLATFSLVVMCLASSLKAQTTPDWLLATERNDRFQTASLVSSDGAMQMHCGTVLGAEASLAEEVIISAAGEFNLVISESLMGAPTPDFWAQRALKGFGSGQEFDLPDFLYDEQGGLGWIASVPFETFFSRLLGGGIEVVINPEIADPFSIDGYVIADAFVKMMEFCATPPSTATLSINADPVLMARADTTLRGECQGEWSAMPDAMQTIDLTGDGLDDLLINRGKVICTTGILAGKQGLGCSDGMCMHQIYTANVETPILLGATAIEPVADAPGSIRLGMNPPSCESMGRDTGCVLRMRWTGTTFGTVGIE